MHKTSGHYYILIVEKMQYYEQFLKKFMKHHQLEDIVKVHYKQVKVTLRNKA